MMKRIIVLLAWGVAFATPARLPAGELPPLPRGVTSFGAAVLDGTLLVYGGHLGERHRYSQEDASGALHSLALDGQADWRQEAGDVPAQSPVVAADGTWLYRAGGMAARNGRGQPQDLWSNDRVARWKPGLAAWEALPPLPGRRSSHDGAIVDGVLHLAGGWSLEGKPSGAAWLEEVWRLDLSNPEAGWTSIPQPFKRRGLAVVALGTDLYCLGGMDSGDGTSLDVDILDTQTGAWRKGPPIPPGRMKGFGASACVAGGRIYLSGMTGVVWRLRESGDGWEEFARLKSPRFFHRLVAWGDNRLIAVGGEDDEGKIGGVEVVSIPSARAEWPGFRGANRDGTGAADALMEWRDGEPSARWKASVGRGMSSFAVGAGRAYTLGNKDGVDTVWCLDVKTGASLWKFSYPSASTNHPMPAVPHGPAATPTLADGFVYTVGREGDLHCLDALTGGLRWQKHLVRDHKGKRPVYGYSGSPLASEGRLYLEVGGAEGSVVALDARDGSLVWRAAPGEAGYSSPILAKLGGKERLVVYGGEALTILDPRDGAALARHATTTGDFCNTVVPALVDGLILISHTGSDGTTCLRFDSGNGTLETVWRRKDVGMLFSSPLALDGLVWGYNDSDRASNVLIALDPATGETRRTLDLVPKSAFTSVGNRLLMVTRQGEFTVLDFSTSAPRRGASLQVFGGRTYAEPVAAGNLALCRNNEGEVVALGVGPGATP